MQDEINKKIQEKKIRNNLPRSIFVPQEDPRQDLRNAVDRVLSDKFMVFLAFLLIPIILLPPFSKHFRVPEIYNFLDVCDFLIIIVFIAEYSLKLYAAKNRWQHFKNPWHILDLIICISPFVEIFPLIGVNVSTSAPLLLRLLRIPRALLVGGRTVASRMRATTKVSEEAVEEPEMKIRMLTGDVIQDNISTDQVKEMLIDTNQEWFDFYDVSEKNLEEIGNLLNISVLPFQSKLSEEIYPHIDYLGNVSMVFLQSSSLRYPETNNNYLTIPRIGFLIICCETNIITISKRKSDIFEKVLEAIKNRYTKQNLVACVLYGIFEHVIKNFRFISNEIETELIKIENIPRNLLPKDFLERTFQFKKELTGLGTNLLHLKEVINNIVQNRVPLEGFNEEWQNLFQVLYDESIYLNDSVINIKENLLSIIDLHMNRTAYETNKVMRILAVITAVAVIPAMVGGLLGQNLLGQPFPVYLWQVVLFVFIGMFFVAYMFYKLGWLKS